MQEGQSFSAEAFPVLGQATAAVQPRNCPFHDPAFGQDLEALGLIGSLDDCDLETAAHPPDTSLEGRTLIATVGIKLQQKRMEPEQRCHEPDAAVTVLNFAGMYKGVQQQALCVYKDMALLALDLLAGVIARRVDRRAPFSALLTLWLSMMAAVGLASRPTFSRH